MSFEPHNSYHRRRGLHRRELRAPLARRDRRGPGGRARCAHLCREPRESRRVWSVIRATCSCAGISVTRMPCASSWSGITSTRWCTSRPNRTSIARSWVRTISSAPTWSARMRCSRRRRRCGSIGKLVPAHRFHHVSTDEVYGSLGPSDAPFHESSPYAPNSPYSASKAGSDHLVRAYHETYGLQTTVTNCSNNYGPYQFPEKLIPLTLINILRGKPLPVYGDGLQVRDWLHVADHCEAIALPGARATGRGLQHRRQQRDDEHRGSSHLVRPRRRAARQGPGAAAGLSRSRRRSSGGRPRNLIEPRPRPSRPRPPLCDRLSKGRAAIWAIRPRGIFARGLRETLDWYLSQSRLVGGASGPRLRAWLELNYKAARSLVHSEPQSDTRWAGAPGVLPWGAHALMMRRQVGSARLVARRAVESGSQCHASMRSRGSSASSPSCCGRVDGLRADHVPDPLQALKDTLGGESARRSTAGRSRGKARITTKRPIKSSNRPRA